VTPVEKLGIVVEDAAFLAVEHDSEGDAESRRLSFRTNVGDLVTAGRITRCALRSKTGPVG
jgi:hypothetical protein